MRGVMDGVTGVAAEWRPLSEIFTAPRLAHDDATPFDIDQVRCISVYVWVICAQPQFLMLKADASTLHYHGG